MLNNHIILFGCGSEAKQDPTPPKRFQKKELPFKVTDLWAEVQKLQTTGYFGDIFYNKIYS